MSHGYGMLRTVLVDDEPPARRRLKTLLKDFPQVKVVGEAENVDGAVEVVTDRNPELVFLDIKMPGAMGFELFDRVELTAKVIFVTAYDNHAVRAFEVNALDYLLKPVHPARLACALGRLLEGKPNTRRQVTAAATVEDTLCLPVGAAVRFAKFKEVDLIRARDDYTEVFLAKGETVLCNRRMYEWDDLLPDQFLRVHRGSIVRLGAIESLRPEPGGWKLYLNSRLPSVAVSRSHLKRIRRLLV